MERITADSTGSPYSQRSGPPPTLADSFPYRFDIVPSLTTTLAPRCSTEVASAVSTLTVQEDSVLAEDLAEEEVCVNEYIVRLSD